MSRKLFVAPHIRRWEDIGLLSPLGVELELRAPDNSRGVLLVFHSMADLLEVYPDTDPELVLVLLEEDP